jgi:ceramide glucosyltransferase
MLYATAVALLIITAWKHRTVDHFFRRPRPAPRRRVNRVSILQPILSGDPTLAQTLGHNLATACTYPREFIWLVDEEDSVAQQICSDLCAAHPNADVQIQLLPRAPQGQNPKTFKLVRGLALAASDVVCVLDDDTMLPPGGLELCLPHLDEPGAGLVFGLPYQVNFGNWWSSLVAAFVNSNSLLTYIPYTALHEPVTINGMFYALRRETLAAIGGFAGLESILADDFAIAQRVRQHGYRLVQTPLRHAISTHVAGPRRYLSLIQRWFIFPRESLMRHLPWRDRRWSTGWRCSRRWRRCCWSSAWLSGRRCRWRCFYSPTWAITTCSAWTGTAAISATPRRSASRGCGRFCKSSFRCNCWPRCCCPSASTGAAM